MNPLNITPENALEEISKFNRKLASGAQTLSNLEEPMDYATEKDTVYQENKLTLYHYRPRVKDPCGVPVLIAYALVNRPYMTDLQPDRSVVRNLLDHGMDVYLIDWGYPDAADRYLTMDDYVNGYLHRCVEFIKDTRGLEAINLLGICQGGSFSLCYASLHPENVRNLITMVTPVDFKTEDNLLSHWSQDMDVDLLVDTLGNIPGDLLNWTYLSLKPFRLTGQKYMGLVDLLDNQEQAQNFMRMEKWIFDSPDQAGECFRQFTKDCYQENKLIKGELELNGKRVDLGNITMPVLNIYAEQDHLVPPSAAQPLEKYVGTGDYTVKAFKGGHIGIYVSGRAQREVPPFIAEWITERV
jgi:polyhydroxyalkanoate synthase